MSLLRRIDASPIDTHLDIDQRVSVRAKRLTLKVNFQTSRIELVIPQRAPTKMIERFLESNEAWIHEKQLELPQRISFVNGASIPLFGNETQIHITKDITKKRTDITIHDNTLHITTNLDDPTPRIVRFLKAKAHETYTILADQKASDIEKEIQALSIRDTKSRWGSCSHDGNISLSWRLIFAPYDAMDYVIAHEVSHLKHMDHSPKFWARCKSLCRNYHDGKLWMKAHGHILMRYG